MNADVERLLASRPQPVAGLARRGCELVQEMDPDAVVTVDGGDIGFGASAGYKGLVFVVSPHSKHVNLGIARGASLPDPAGLMEGTGKVHRHVKVRHPADLERLELRDLMVAALARPHDGGSRQ
jgi:hypothetical protein